MASNYLAVTNTAIDFTKSATPFSRGYNAICHNNSGGSLVLQTSDDGTTYADTYTIADKAFANVAIAPFMKCKTAATLHLIA